MRVLITNSTLALRGGTEAYTQDLAAALGRSGHDVAAYSNIVGEAAADLRSAGTLVVDKLADLPWVPDILHCHHNTEAMTALLYFPSTPAIFVSHGWTRWIDAPISHPRILRYVAVDAPTRTALIDRHGIEGDRIALIPNFVDLARFVQRSALPSKPRRGLVLSHYAREDTHLPVVREACRRCQLTLDIAGYGAGRPVDHPEQLLGHYDIVFAKGRAALEALAVGCAVVVCDAFGLGPMLTMENTPALRTLEGDYMRWYRPLGVDALEREIREYDAADASRVTAWIRTVADAAIVVPEIVRLYEDVRRESATKAVDAIADQRAAAAYVRWLSGYIKEQMVERDPLAGLAVRLRNRLARVPLLAPLLLRVSARIQKKWPARSSPGNLEPLDRT